MRVVSFSVPAWFPSYGAGPPRVRLTDQESAVFLLLATGASNTELAAELQLSVSTVKFHVGNIRAKLGGVSRLQACLLAALARDGRRLQEPPRPGDVPTADPTPLSDAGAADDPR
ncbi:helix-turn-helix transcriptional regulator [Streptomyces sp. Isolate_45]|uniref:response regulator transcription factor n=1 Tax=Streptomyces sp. Isolate_45 TaxID=2950111 RepID=UPI002481EFDF|nr:helix-turn-helix transcriptional regulator [Streptomyces sp. Isolate_45]MDA5280563.1 helix-turn-helix transcriptional regulator [Streptomyces sp. Isolate_45]